MQSDVSYWNLIYKARLHDMFLQILLSFCFFLYIWTFSPQWVWILSHEDIAAGTFKVMLHGKIGPSGVNR